MSTTANPFGAFNIADFWRSWLQLAPNTLAQPILTGWRVNLNSNNGSAPQTEVDVVAEHSYGRQIGRISDALRELIHDQHPDPQKPGPFGDFMSMWDDIEKIKAKSAAARLAHAAADLTLVKERDPKAYAQLRADLQKALKDLG
jgi:hypothetical protein